MSIYGPHEDEYTDFLEKSFLAGKFVASTGYGASLSLSFSLPIVVNHLFRAGVQLVLYVWCMLYLQSRRKRRGRVMRYLLVYTTILLCLASIFVAAGTWTVEEMYINNRNYPGGPWAYFLESQHLPQNVMFFVSFFVLTFLSDLLVVRFTAFSYFLIYHVSALALLGYLELFGKARRLRGDSISYNRASRIFW